MAKQNVSPSETQEQVESDFKLSILTVVEAAKLLRVSKNHLYAIIRGQVPGVTALPVITLGRRLLVRSDTLEAWVRENNRSRN